MLSELKLRVPSLSLNENGNLGIMVKVYSIYADEASKESLSERLETCLVSEGT